jgi:RNA polymerase sigma-70 factor (ECF subfamily)
VEGDIEQADRHELVEHALRKLPRLSESSVLYHLEGLRYEEIAAKLKISLGKVKTDIFEAEKPTEKLGTQLGRAASLRSYG